MSLTTVNRASVMNGKESVHVRNDGIIHGCCVNLSTTKGSKAWQKAHAQCLFLVWSAIILQNVESGTKMSNYFVVLCFVISLSDTFSLFFSTWKANHPQEPCKYFVFMLILHISGFWNIVKRTCYYRICSFDLNFECFGLYWW